MVDTEVAWFGDRASSCSLKPVYLSISPWKVLTITFDVPNVGQCRTSSIPTHFKCKPIATKIKPIISESLTPDKITSPDSVRAASLESTYRMEFFISSSSSSLQSGLLAPTAKATKLMNSGAMFKTNSNHILFKRHV